MRRLMAIHVAGFVPATATLICGMKYCGLMPDHMTWFKASFASVIFGVILGLLFSVLHYEADRRSEDRRNGKTSKGGWVLLWTGGSLAITCLGLFAIGIVFDRHEYRWHMVFGWLFIVYVSLACTAIAFRQPSNPRS